MNELVRVRRYAPREEALLHDVFFSAVHLTAWRGFLKRRRPRAHVATTPEGFRDRAGMLAWTTAICLIASPIWPKRSFAKHVLAPLCGVFGARVTHVLLRLILTVLAAFAEERYPRLPLAYILFAFYGGVLGTVLGLVTYPFQLHSLQFSQMPVAY